METFFKTHKYLVEHLYSPVRRGLTDEINWGDRLIGIKGSRGVGKTTFLLHIAREHFGADNRECLYINLNHFYFTQHTLIEFASGFRDGGGCVLLIDQVFKYPGWSKELRYCYDHFTDLKIVFTGSTVMRLKEENPDLSGKVVSYHLRGYSFREYLNLTAGTDFPMYTFEELLANHRDMAEQIVSKVCPLDYFEGYLHHGFYPFFLEKRNYSENLLKTLNMILEIDVLYIKQIEQSYLPKLRKLLYLLAGNASGSLNISRLSEEIETSRATVMNYIKYLTDARLTNLLYKEGEMFPKKPARVYMYSPNQMYPIRPEGIRPQVVLETFFFNQLMKDNRLNESKRREAHFLVNGQYNFRIEEGGKKGKRHPELYYATNKIKVGEGNVIPLWMFGFLY